MTTCKIPYPDSKTGQMGSYFRGVQSEIYYCSEAFEENGKWGSGICRIPFPLKKKRNIRRETNVGNKC